MSPTSYSRKVGPHSSHRKIIKLLSSVTPGTAIDAGCASGYLANDLTDLGWSVIGIEPDESAAEQASKYCAQVIQEPLERIDFCSLQPVNAVIFGDVLEHLSDPVTVLRSVHSCLASDGSVIVSVPNIANITIRGQLLMGRFDYTDKGILDRTHLRFFTRKSFRQFVSDSGFRIDEICMTPIPLEEVLPRLKSPGWHWLLASIDRVTAVIPGLLGYQILARLTPAQTVSS